MPADAGISSSWLYAFAVWAESHGPVQDAIARGKALKVWKRAWKIGLMEATSPEWADRYERLA